MILHTHTRGEIAVRILSSARELGLHTLAIFTADDDAHVSHAHEAIELPSASSYTDAAFLVALCKEHRVRLVHPGYGFLSESPEFCAQLSRAGITFVGPGPEVLRRTGDKLGARRLAEQCGVPVLPALTEPVDDDGGIETLRAFVREVGGVPVMIKAVDGGGGRGIRLVTDESQLEEGLRRAASESPSGRVFAEKAAVDGYRHVEVQILGDGLGHVRHFWERECSIQRRFQKMVEVAPSTVSDRRLVDSVIDAAVRMARAIKYASLGTWEFLVSEERSLFYFMEINPRLQVEHTVTEAICRVDLVRWQILIAQGKSVVDLVRDSGPLDERIPASVAIQLRITAEDPRHNFSASIGRIRHVLFPGGNGLRVDSHLRSGVTVGADFDSLLAKVIVTGRDWTAAVAKAERALEDVVVDGVATNIALLQRIVRSPEFMACKFDTQWLEKQLQNNPGFVVEDVPRHANPAAFKAGTQSPTTRSSSHSSDQIIKKGDQFDIQIEGDGLPAGPFRSHGMTITGIKRNDFPNSLALELSASRAKSRDHDTRHTAGASYTLNVSKHSDARQGLGPPSPGSTKSAPPSDGGHSPLVICPLAGQLVEILVDEGDQVGEGDAIVVVRQMKMELEVRAHRSGVVGSLFEQEEGDEVSVGTVICSILTGDKEKL